MRKGSLISGCIIITGVLISNFSFGQLKWQNVDAEFQLSASSVHVYYTRQPIDTAAFSAYYLIADIKDKDLVFTVDTSRDRRLTPSAFFERNDKPLLVVNCTFFSFKSNRSVNTVVKDGRLVAFNEHTMPDKDEKDKVVYRHPFGSAIGISKKRKADIAWVYTDSLLKYPYASQFVLPLIKDSIPAPGKKYLFSQVSTPAHRGFEKWKMQTVVGGGPVLIQNGEIKITNNEELKFVGIAATVKHPRTAIGYTKDNKLIVLVIQGRSESSSGASLAQTAQILKDLGCWEALNLDGGGSSCMLVNGKETITPSDKEGQRPVPAVFIIKKKK